MTLLQNEAFIALIGILLGAPFLNFIITAYRARADRSAIVATGASTAVNAMQTSIENLRIDLIDARRELDAARDEIDNMRIQHVREMADLKTEHRLEVQTARSEARELRQLVAELEQQIRVLREGRVR